MCETQIPFDSAGNGGNLKHSLFCRFSQIRQSVRASSASRSNTMAAKWVRAGGKSFSLLRSRRMVILSLLAAIGMGGARVQADVFVHTTAQLSAGRGEMGAGSGNHVAVFAGGYDPFFTPPAGFEGTVDIYNATTGTWSTGSISPRDIPAVVSLGENIYIGGGGYSLGGP